MRPSMRNYHLVALSCMSKDHPRIFAPGNSVAYSRNTFRLTDELADVTFRHHFYSIRLPIGA